MRGDRHDIDLTELEAELARPRRSTHIRLQELASSGDPRAVRLLERGLQSPDEWTRNIAATSLGLYGRAPAHKPLIAAMPLAGETLRGIMAESLGQIGERAATPVLIELLRDAEEPTVRSKAGDGDGRAGGRARTGRAVPSPRRQVHPQGREVAAGGRGGGGGVRGRALNALP